LENPTNFQQGQQGQCWTNQPPQGPWGGTPWGYQGPWGWWNGPVSQGPMPTEDQAENAERREAMPPNASYGECNPHAYYGYPTGWNQWYQPYQQQWWNQWHQPYQQQWWNQWYQPYQQQWWNQWYQPYQQYSYSPYYQWWSQWGRQHMPYTQWNWHYPNSWQQSHTWGRAWTPGYQTWNWGHPYCGGQDAWWYPMAA